MPANARRTADVRQVPSLLDGRLLAFICSSKCPGNVILDVYDLARQLRHAAVEVLVAHAAAGGKTEAFCRELVGTRKPLLTIARLENRFLLDLGAEALTAASIRQRWPYASVAGKHRKGNP